MGYSKIFILIWVMLFITFIFINKKFKWVIFLSITLVLFLPLILPSKIWGKWDSTSALRGKEVSKILLRPSTPDWEVNLTDSPEVVSDRNKINQIVEYLKETELYFPGHPRRIWETELIFITQENDTIPFQIEKTENNGTVISSPDDRWRNDEIAGYLEDLANYHKPLRAKKY